MKMPNLCKPSYVYLLLSIFTMCILYVQNYDNTTIYCVGFLMNAMSRTQHLYF